jgi:hypothetical protein
MKPAWKEMIPHLSKDAENTPHKVRNEAALDVET